jgi:hypothetical protein
MADGAKIDIWAGVLPASGTIPAQIAERHDSRPVRAAVPDRVDGGLTELR